MGQGLAVKPDQLGPFQPRQNRRVRRFDRFGGLRHPGLTRPAPERGAQHGALTLRIGAVAGVAELENCLSIGAQERRIDAIQRRPRHRAGHPYRPFHRAILPGITPELTEWTDKS